MSYVASVAYCAARDVGNKFFFLGTSNSVNSFKLNRGKMLVKGF